MALLSLRDLDHIMIASAEPGRVASQRELARRLGVSHTALQKAQRAGVMMSGEHLLDELGRFDGDAEILQAWRDGMAPEPALLVSEWADRHRLLGRAPRGERCRAPVQTLGDSASLDWSAAVAAFEAARQRAHCLA